MTPFHEAQRDEAAREQWDASPMLGLVTLATIALALTLLVTGLTGVYDPGTEARCATDEECVALDRRATR